MFEEFHPLNKKMFQILDCNGNLVNQKYMPALSSDEVLYYYQKMLYARQVDLKAVSYQRQGRMYTYPPNKGQEAIAIGTGALITDDDWLVPAYRELGAYFMKGATLKDLLLYWGGHEDGAKLPTVKNMLPISVPISSQLLHAVGIAFGLKHQQKPGVVFVYFGDGGTSQGDFHEALNFASVWQAPVLFICQNNQYAISLPRHKQTRSESIAIKSLAYGMTGVQVDGNDFLAMYQATGQAYEYAKAGNGPVLIEAVTYRLGAHTTADDPRRYRSEEEELEWVTKDPIIRLRQYLMTQNKWSMEADQELINQYNNDIDRDFNEVENPEYFLEDVFKYQYEKMPPDLKRQMEECRQFYGWNKTYLKQQEVDYEAYL